MLIHEVCKLLNLTKKAIAYYEHEGLVCPATSENGYRIYTDIEISALKEISLLRKLGMGIAEIKVVLASNDKSTVLSNCISRINRQITVLEEQKECVNYLINHNYDIDGSLKYAANRLDDNRIIKDKLVEAFPGNYGLFLSHHFGRFLNENVDNREKATAYGCVVDFLDSLADFPIPKELEEYLQISISTLDSDTIQDMMCSVTAALDDCSVYMEQHKSEIVEYLEYCNSDEYKNSTVYKMKQLMVEFQKASGYYDIFIPNLKILSKAYAEYAEKLSTVNTIFLQEYPDAANLQ